MEGLRDQRRDRLKTMTLDAAEFIRRFFLYALRRGFHRGCCRKHTPAV
jgi:hypothetical protein